MVSRQLIFAPSHVQSGVSSPLCQIVIRRPSALTLACAGIHRVRLVPLLSRRKQRPGVSRCHCGPTPPREISTRTSSGTLSEATTQRYAPSRKKVTSKEVITPLVDPEP